MERPYFTIIKHKQFMGLKTMPFTRMSSQNMNVFLNAFVQQETDGKTSEHNIITDTKRKEAGNNS